MSEPDDSPITPDLGAILSGGVPRDPQLISLLHTLIQETRRTNACLTDAAGWRQHHNNRISAVEQSIADIREQAVEIKTDVLNLSHQIQEVSVNARHSVELMDVQFRNFNDVLKGIINRSFDKSHHSDVNVNLNNTSTNTNNTSEKNESDGKTNGSKSKKGFFVGLSGLIGGAGLMFEKEVIEGATRIISFFSNILKGNT